MGCFEIFCTVCGGPLNSCEMWDSLRSLGPDPAPRMYWDYNQELLREEDLMWLENIRIVAEWQSKEDQDKHHPVAAEIYTSSQFDAGSAMLDATYEGVTHWCYAFGIRENEDSYPGNHFVMHSACLLIARRWMLEQEKSTQDLYTALSVYPADDLIGVCLPNRHYGAQQFWGQDWEAKQGWEFLVKDPVNIPGVTEYILTTLQSVSPEEEGECLVNSLDTGSGATAPSSGDTGPSIQDLPIEIIRQVCADLPLCAILSLRLSCRDFRQRIAMDQAFYRSQLLSGHFFALDLNLGLVRGRWSEIKDKDWRRLVKDLARYENFYAGEGGGSSEPGKLRDAPIGLKNRMRILKIVQDIFTGT